MSENPPAFPRLDALHDRDPGGRLYDARSVGGMTLRDYFAARVIDRLFPNQPAETAAAWAYAYADAMLAERAKQETK